MTYRCHYRGAESVMEGRRWLSARLHAGVSRHPTSTRGLIAAPWTPASLSLLRERSGQAALAVCEFKP